MSFAGLPGAVRADLFGGVGEVVVRDWLGPASPPFEAVLACTLAAGGRVGRHRQQRASEVVIVVAGHGDAEVDGVRRPLAPGAAVVVPFGASLALSCAPDAPLDYLIVKVSPAGGRWRRRRQRSRRQRR